MITLNQRERDKFASWLEWEAECARGLLGHVKKLGEPIASTMGKVFEVEIVSSLTIAKKLRDTEDMTMGEQPLETD